VILCLGVTNRVEMRDEEVRIDEINCRDLLQIGLFTYVLLLGATVSLSIILGAFSHVRKASICFVLSVCPSASTSPPPSTGRIFMKFFSIFTEISLETSSF
jgi:hypothetical protein